MAAAAYAAVVSLINIMEQIRNHPPLSTSFDMNQIESLGENLDSLLDFVEINSSYRGASKQAEDLEMRIATVAHAAEDVIESYIVDQIHGEFEEKSHNFSTYLQEIIQDMSLINEEVFKVREDRLCEVQQPTFSRAEASSTPSNSGKNTTSMLGFSEVLNQLLDRLTSGESRREIIPIVGAGGVGKTMLASTVYQHVVILQHFDIRAWVNVSQEYSVGKILLKLVSDCLGLGESHDKLVEFTGDHDLGVQLYESLIGRRYLIILDDMWEVEVWDKIKIFLPDNANGSRIVVTARQSHFASEFSFSGFKISFLDEEESWNLFCQTVFGLESCPPELEEIGKMIVRYCRGLPLSITVIGGLLGKSSRTRDNWEYVAENIDSILDSDEDNQLLKILSLSYNSLPACLKPCFLYMGIFPQDHEIRVSQIIKLWVAEGFLKPDKDRTLEEVGVDHLNELIGRNLVVVSIRGSNGKPKTCQIHDLVRRLCIRLVEKEKFLCLMRAVDLPRGINSERRIVVHQKYRNLQYFHALESSSLARSLIYESPALVSFKSRLLRVMIEVYSDSLDSTFKQVNLRFLACESIQAPIDWIRRYELPSSISLLWNVQTLIIDKKIEEVVAPSEIWKMPQLRHLDFYRVSLPEPPASEDKDIVLRNLQTLGMVLNFKFSEEVCKRMPNIKKLRIFYDDFLGDGVKNSSYCIDHVGRFSKLESLYYFFHKVPNHDDLVQNLKFPRSLRKLILQDCELHWDDLSIIGSLPNLEVLKLKSQSVRGPKWETAKGEFPSLRMLEIDSCYLNHWFSESSHFPSLEKLVLCRLHRLSEIPSRIGDVVTLRNIHVVECSISAAISAVRMLKEREELDDERLLEVRVRFRKEKEVAEFTAKVEVEGLPSHGLQIAGV